MSKTPLISMCALLVSWPLLAAPVLEEVIVTAQKREESLQDTPIALDAFGEGRLEREGISGVGDLANNVPALTIEPFPISNSTLRIYIRGIGLIDAQITQDPPVGVYVDGVYVARSNGLVSEVADLSRIEVLRGPQGTLYGRNSTGGAINMITKRPNVDELEFQQAFTVGNRSHYSAKTSLNLPLWQGAAAKLAYFSREIDGFIERTGPGGGDDNFGDKDNEGYRLDFGWDVNEELRVDYSYDASDLKSLTQTYSPVSPAVPLDTGDPTTDAVSNQLRQGAIPFYNFTGRTRPDSLATPRRPLPSESDIEGHTLTFNYSFSDQLEFKYIYGQRELVDAAYVNLAGGTSSEGYRLDTNAAFTFDADVATLQARSVNLPGVRFVLDQDQSSHELQFTGNLFESRLSYIAGIYYFEETASERHKLGFQARIPVGGTNTRLEVLTADASNIDNEAFAYFTQLTWVPPVLEERLSITFGARHSEDSRKADIDRRVVTFAEIPAMGVTEVSPLDTAVLLSDDRLAAAGDKDFQDDSFALILEYVIADEINVYAKAVEAYKSGGFNIREPIAGNFGGEASVARFSNGFEPEKALAYELGIKTQLFDRRLRINADVFATDITDQQLNFNVPGSLDDTSVANAGESELSGAELDITYAAAQNLTLMLNYAYLDASVAPSANPLTGEPDEGFVFSSAPRHAYTAAVDWTIMQSSIGRLAFNGTYSYTGERNGGARREFSTFQFDRVDDYAVINARLGLYDVPFLGGDLTVALWGKNLADEEYTVNNLHQTFHGSRVSIWGESRTYGLDLIYRLAR